MMKKFLIAVLAVAGFAAAYAGIQVITVSSDLESDQTMVWTKTNAGGNTAASVAVPQAGLGKDGSKGVSVLSVAGAKEDWDAQAWILWEDALPAGTVVNVSFDYKASAPVTIGTQSHAGAGEYLHWAAIGDIAFTTEWKTFNGSMTVANEADGMHSIAFNLSKDRENDVTFYFDNVKVSYEKEVEDPDVVYDWVDVTADQHVVKLYENQFSNQSGAITVVSQAKQSQDWDTQIWFVMDKALDAKTKVKLTFDAKASSAQNLGFGAHGAPDGNNWKAGGICNAIDVTTDWQTFEREFTAQAGWQSFALDLTKAAEVTYDFKNIKIEAWQEIELVTEVEPALVCGEEEYGLNTHSIVTVESASAITANILNCPQAIGASYNINVMNMGQDEEGIFWSVGQEIAAGEMSLSTVAYAELEKPINFEAGKKYQLAITVYGQPASDPVEVGTYYFEFAGSYIAPEYVEETSDMTKEMFCQWDGFGAVANVVRTSAGACDLGISTGLPYGDGNVAGSYYANLSEYTTLALTVTEGTPRLLLNRQGMDNSGNYIEINNANSPYVLSTEGGVWVIDLAKIVEEAGYAHLNCIKGANWANTTITSMKLTKLVEAEPVEPAVLPSLIAGEEEIALNGHSEATVESAEAVAVAFEGFVPFGASYSISTLKQVATAEGTEWVADNKIAEGMMSLSGKAYAEFGKTVVFEQGTKYQLEVVWRDVEGIINGTAQFIINGATAKGIEDGDYVVMNVMGGYIGGGNDWGTHASLIGKPQWFTLAAMEDGTYTLDSHQSNGGDSHYLNVSGYCDGAAYGWSFVELGDGIYTIQDKDGRYLVANGMNATLAFAAGLPENQYAAMWSLVPMSKFVEDMDLATADDPIDVTALIKDPELKRNGNNVDWAWTITAFNGEGKPNNWAEGQGGNKANCGESFMSGNGFKAVQTITLPKAGVYTLSAQAFYREQGEPNNVLPYLFAGEQKSEFPLIKGTENSMPEAYASFLNKLYTVEPITIVATEAGETVEIGFAGEDATKWNIFGELELLYLGKAEEEPAEMTVTPSLFAGFEDLEAAYAGELGTEYTLNTHSLVSVDVAEGLHVEVANCPEAIGITFMLNEMLQGQDEDVTFWHVGKELAVGEINMKLDSYAAFEAPITFYAGTKYQLTVTVFAEVNGEPAEISTTTYQFNGSSAPVNGSVADGINSIELNSVNGKFIKNGKVVIVKNGKTYNINGVQVK